jgi:hypothetical protein
MIEKSGAFSVTALFQVGSYVRFYTERIGDGLQEAGAELQIGLEMVTLRPFVPGFQEQQSLI